MNPLGWTFGLATLLGSGTYVFVYLTRWEWHRALLAGVLCLAALVVLSAALVLTRLSRLERSLSRGVAEQRALRVLQAAPAEPAAFPWLRPDDLSRTSIFIPVLLGSGVVLSGLAWLVERVAGSAARTGVEQQLARDLVGIAFPTATLVPDAAEALAGAQGADSPGLRLLLGPPGPAAGPAARR